MTGNADDTGRLHARPGSANIAADAIGRASGATVVMIQSPTSKRARTAAALAYLARRFPAAFAGSAADVQPLAVGIRAPLAEACAADPEADAPAVLWALRRWCLARAYLEAIAAGRARVDLDGQPAEAPAVEHQAQARARLDTEGAATAARAERRAKAERAQAQAKDKAKGSTGAGPRAPQPTAGRSAAPATTRPAAPATTRPAAAAVVTRTRAGRLSTPAPGAPAADPKGAPAPRPVLGLGKRPKPTE